MIIQRDFASSRPAGTGGPDDMFLGLECVYEVSGNTVSPCERTPLAVAQTVFGLGRSHCNGSRIDRMDDHAGYPRSSRTVTIRNR